MCGFTAAAAMAALPTVLEAMGIGGAGAAGAAGTGAGLSGALAGMPGLAGMSALIPSAAAPMIDLSAAGAPALSTFSGAPAATAGGSSSMIGSLGNFVGGVGKDTMLQGIMQMLFPQQHPRQIPDAGGQGMSPGPIAPPIQLPEISRSRQQSVGGFGEMDDGLIQLLMQAAKNRVYS